MASGDSLFILSGASGTPPAANAASREILAGASTPAEAFIRLAFDDTTDEYWDWHLFMPESYAGGGITITMETMAAAASGTYVFGLAFRIIADDADDLDTTSHTYDYNDSSAITAPTAIGETSQDNVTFTDGADMDSVGAGDSFVLRIRCDGSAGSSVGDCYLKQLTVKET